MARRRTLSPGERFWAKVQITPSCWLWLGAKSDRGYGVFWVDENTKLAHAHRFCLEQILGSIPSSLEIDHLCRNRACVNPLHLEPVTKKENILRGESPFAVHARKTHCKNGHTFDSENTRVVSSGKGGIGRQCKECGRVSARRCYRRKVGSR